MVGFELGIVDIRRRVRGPRRTDKMAFLLAGSVVRYVKKMAAWTVSAKGLAIRSRRAYSLTKRVIVYFPHWQREIPRLGPAGGI